jgi:hypothetical protein
MAQFEREVVEGPQIQGEDERIIWTLDITPWGSSPTDMVFVLKDSTGTDVTAAHCTGSPTAVSATLVNTPTIHSLDPGEQYRAELRFTSGGQVMEPFFILIAEV